ncbi:MAG: CatB-related O-acetyltransferase [Clostridiales bacterium]|jgi:acetyltransferase-like isoleucine patch superfamily enzyme|nr:CatB-related O-acetyltransferase [Clostridiales bacterium]
MLLTKNRRWLPIEVSRILHVYRARLAHGKNVHILSPFVSLKAKLDYGVIIGENTIVTEEAVVGRHTYTGMNCTIAIANVGSFTSMGNNITIGAFGHRYPICVNSAHARRILGMPYFPEPLTVVGNDVWIGHNAVVMSGVTIGNGAIVGSNAVVTHDVPHYAIVAGVPAKVIGYRYEEKIVNELLESKWWEWSDEKIVENKDFFTKYPSRMKVGAEQNKALD